MWTEVCPLAELLHEIMRRPRKHRGIRSASCDQKDNTQYYTFLGVRLDRPLDYNLDVQYYMKILGTELRYPQDGTNDDSKEILTIEDIGFLHTTSSAKWFRR